MDYPEFFTSRTHGFLDAPEEFFRRTHGLPTQNTNCAPKSRVLITAVLMTSLAVAILGALALIGVHLPPQSPLGVLGGSFGQAGAIATLAGGLVIFTSVLVILLVRHLKKDVPSDLSKPSLGDFRNFVDRSGSGGGSQDPPTYPSTTRIDSNVSFE